MPDVPELEGLKVAIDAVLAAGPAAFADGDTLTRLYAQAERLQCAVTQSTGAFEAGAEWATAGARTAAAWISTECRMPLGAARRRVRLARELRHMPESERAWSDGSIGEAHVSLLSRARTPQTAEAFERDEAMLVGEAVKLRHHQFDRVVAYWRQLADPDGVEHDAAAVHDSRYLYLSPGLDGVGFLDGKLDPITHAIVDDRLRAIERELFETDWAEARLRLGREPALVDLRRTPAQRRCDALAEMARRAGAVPADGRMPEPLFTIFVGYETFAGRMCQLANGNVVAPGQIVPWLTDAYIERVVFDGPDRVKNVGPRRRLFKGATRRSVVVREHECFNHYCEIPSDRTEVDHIIPFSEGGPTIDTNGRPACGFHNRHRQRRPEPPE